MRRTLPEVQQLEETDLTGKRHRHKRREMKTDDIDIEVETKKKCLISNDLYADCLLAQGHFLHYSINYQQRIK